MIRLNKELNERDSKIVKMLLSGENCVEIAKKFGVSSQRIHQISKIYNVEIIKTRRELKTKVSKLIFTPLIESMDVMVIREKLGLTSSNVQCLNVNDGVDMRIYGGEYQKKGDKACYDLYMEGYKASEVVNMLKDKYGYISKIPIVYKIVRRYSKLDRIPNRLSKKTIASNNLDKEITKLFKRGKDDKDILSILIRNGFKNVDGGELKLPVIVWRIENKLKLRVRVR
jgi:transposase